MNPIYPLNSTDLDEAYQIEVRSHIIPWSRKTFESNQGDRYLNKKICHKNINTDINQIVGFVICQIVLDEATIFNIAIDPDWQKQGLATQLLQNLIDELMEKNIQTLWLEVRESNHLARKLYEKIGFNEITIRKNYYPTKTGKEDAIIMAYTLSL